MSEAFDMIRQILCEEAEMSGCGRAPGGYCERCEKTARRIHNDLTRMAMDKAVLDPSRLNQAMAEQIATSPLASDDAKAIAGARLRGREAA